MRAMTKTLGVVLFLWLLAVEARAIDPPQGPPPQAPAPSTESASNRGQHHSRTTTPPTSTSGNWLLYADTTASFFVDPSTRVQVANGLIRMWERQVRRIALPLPGFGLIKSSFALREYDCSQRTARRLQTDAYSASGQLLIHDGVAQAAEAVVPETVMDVLLAHACAPLEQWGAIPVSGGTSPLRVPNGTDPLHFADSVLYNDGSVASQSSDQPDDAGSSQAVAGFWLIEFTGSGATFADQSTRVYISHGLRRIWVTTVFREPLRSGGKYGSEFREYNCERRVYRTLETNFFLSSGEFLVHESTPDAAETPIPSDSVGASVLAAACAPFADWAGTLHLTQLPVGANIVQYADSVLFQHSAERKD